MQEIRNHLHGRQVLSSDTAFNGLLDGDLIVPQGITLNLHGMVNGDVRIDAGGTAQINGMVNGTVFNNGGNVTIYGTVDRVAGTHPSTIDANAVIRK